MTKSAYIPASVTRLIIAWFVIALLTISIMKASAGSGRNDRLPNFQSIPSLNWNKSF
jgi:hypothetical protein